MIGALIILLILTVVLALFIGKNVHHTCSIWFFHEFKDLSSVSVIMISFAVGIVFTMLCFLISYLIKKNKEDLAKKRAGSSVSGYGTGSGSGVGTGAGSAKPKTGKPLFSKGLFKFGKSKDNQPKNTSSGIVPVQEKGDEK